ncbi:MAG TPA: CPBP family intramembrane glutamic endopeptidase [Steroidobacteraceae bacterium]|nr:CPBP family intramembrane glutamic endopeptidase [Steroidobacteraceae bacterium]
MSARDSPAWTFLAFLFALLGAMLLAAVASPWVMWLLAPLHAFPLHRIFSRLTMLGVIGFTVWLLMRHGLAQRELLGYQRPPRVFLLRLLAGLAVGLVLMSIAVIPLFLLHVREWNAARLATAGILPVALKGLGSGLLVALIEETFFRGAMQGALMRQGARSMALFAVPAFYAAVHFLGRAESVPAEQVDALSGFIALGGFFSGFAEPLRILDAFVALYAVGLLLALVRRRFGDLAGCIGLHAGFVAVITVFRKISVAAAPGEWSFLVGGFDGLLGLWLALLTSLLCVAVWRPDPVSRMERA